MRNDLFFLQMHRRRLVRDVTSMLYCSTSHSDETYVG